MAIDILAAFETEPPALDFVWPGFLAGTVGALIAPGATGKSFWALQAAMAVACPEADLLGLRPAHRGTVVYLAADDPAIVLQHRLHAIGAHLSPEARDGVAERLFIEPLMGRGLDLTEESHQKVIITYGKDARLIIIDTLSRIHTLDENNNGAMSHLVSVLEHIAVSTGAAILFLHHAAKWSARDGQLDQQQAARGASALIDNARWCGFVAKMTEEESKRLSDRTDRRPIDDRRTFFVRFGVSKQNYGLIQPDRWYFRHDGGVLKPVDVVAAAEKNGGRNRDHA